MRCARVWVCCVRVADNAASERFMLFALDSAKAEGAIIKSLPLVERDVRDELEKLGLADEEIDAHIAKARSFKTTTTSRDWWAVAFGAR
jgi:hypothetical protein